MILLGDLLSGELLPDQETAALWAFASTHMLAHACRTTQLGEMDRQVLAALLGRWAQAVDSEQDFHEPRDRFDADRGSLAFVAAIDPKSLDRSIRRLIDAQLVTAHARDQFDLAGLLASAADDLAPLLYRDFFERHGRDLVALGIFGLGSLKDDLDSISEDRPDDARVGELRMKLQRIRTNMGADAWLRRWRERPRDVYDWLNDLIAIEDQIALLSASPSTVLASSLAFRSTQRIVILSGRLVPAPARAA